MDRTELTIVAAAALMVALGLGWVLRWVYSLLNPPPPPAPKADSEWAEYARSCEAQRDEALARLAEVEGELGTKLTQAHSELNAAMEGLGAARRTTQELEARLADIEATKTNLHAPVALAPVEPVVPQPDEGTRSKAGDAEPGAAESALSVEAAAPTPETPDAAPEQSLADTADAEPKVDVTHAAPAETGSGADDAAAKAETPEAEEASDGADKAEAESDVAGAEPADGDAGPEKPETQETGAKPKNPRRRSTRGGTGAKRNRRSSTKT